MSLVSENVDAVVSNMANGVPSAYHEGVAHVASNAIATAAGGEDVAADCAAVLSRLVSEVERSEALSWLATFKSTEPNREDAKVWLRIIHRSLNKPAFAKRLYANSDALGALMGCARSFVVPALLCVVRLLDYEYRNNQEQVHHMTFETGVWQHFVKMGASKSTSRRGDARGALASLSMAGVQPFHSAFFAHELVVDFLARAFEDGYKFAAAMLKSDLLSDAKVVEVRVAVHPTLARVQLIARASVYHAQTRCTAISRLTF